MFRRSPSLKILVFAILGFVFHKYIPLSLFILILLCFKLFIFAVLFALLIRNKLPALIFLAFLFGIITSVRTHHLDFENVNSCNRDKNGYFYGNVSKVLKSTNKYSRVIIDGKILNDEWKLIGQTRFLLTMLNSKRKEPYQIGNNDVLTGAIKYKLPTKANLPNEFNELNYLRNMECEFSAFGFSNKIALIPVNAPPEVREKIRQSIFNKIETLYSKSTQGIIKAILLGDKSEIHRNVRQEFSVAGVAHILAVSGFHVGIIAGILYWLFSFFRNEYVKFLLISVTLSSYIYLIDFQPSAVRAGIMILLFLFAYLIQRKANPINIISTTILLVMVVNPTSLYSVGFQMSIAAISGIFILYTPFKNFFFEFLKFDKNEFTKKIGNTLAVSMGASVIVSPIVAYYFGIYSIISPLANLVVIPFMLFGQIFGIVSLIMSYIFLPVGYVFANTSQLAIEIAMTLTHYAANLPFSHVSGNLVIPISILTSLFLIYIFHSNTRQQIVFRMSFVAIWILVFSINNAIKSDPKITVYERANAYLIENKVKNTQVVIGKKDCKHNWNDYGLLNYLKQNKSKIILHNVSPQIKVNLYKNKIRYMNLRSKKQIEEVIN